MDDYRARHAARAEALAREQLTSDRIGNIRLVLAIVALIVVLLPLFVRHGGVWYALIPVGLVFLLLGAWHDRVERRRRRAHAATLYYRAELDRFEEKWRVFTDDGGDLVPARRDLAELAADLDLFGPASLFQLLNRSVTLYGRRTLAQWLVEPAELETLNRRQQAVVELRTAVDLREALAVAARGEDSALRDEQLLDWAEREESVPARRLLGFLGVAQPILLVASAVVYWVTGYAWPLALAALGHIATLLATRRMVQSRADYVSSPERTLSRYSELLATIESSNPRSAFLVELVGRLHSDVSASKQIRRLQRIIELLDARLNVLFALTLGPALLWELNLVLRAERWRESVGPAMRGWFRTMGEFEAVASLGAFAFERADYALPEIVSEYGSYVAEGLAHPLIDRARVVANDVTLGGPGSVLLLSGSNMSGKSTFLRALGISLVLARAGAPVPARSLKASASVLVTSIRVTDSLARGTSHFYAELERLRQALDAARTHDGRVIYLLDEMLHGTNSRERYIGAASMIRWLSARGAIGVVTTHDLALASVESELEPGRLTNMHFGDSVTDGRILFDYRLKSGPVQSTNALRLMKAIGIDIELVPTEGLV